MPCIVSVQQSKIVRTLKGGCPTRPTRRDVGTRGNRCPLFVGHPARLVKVGIMQHKVETFDSSTVRALGQLQLQRQDPHPQPFDRVDPV
jgi:hypothetical protein